jgi:hypothetical protein
MTRNRKRLGFLPRWRIFTYVIIATNLVMLGWVITSVMSANSDKDCGRPQALTCTAGTDAGPGIAALAVIAVWVLLIVILGALWLNTGQDKTRPCPECGHDVDFGTFQCGHCAFAFRDRRHRHPAYFHRQVPHS